MSAEPLRDRRAERHEATRAEILDHAWRMAELHGLAALSLRELARVVGMRAPSLYSYFPSKHAIYDAMFAQGAQQFRGHYGQLELSGDPHADLAASMRSFLDFCTQNTSRYQLLFQRTIPGFEPSPESFAISVAGYEDMRRHMHGIGITEPEALDLLTALTTGLADQQISNDPGGTRWIRLIDQAAAMFLAHTRRRPPSKRSR